MAEKSPARKTRQASGESGSGSRSGRKSGRRLSGGQLAQRARQELAEITGLEPEGVTSLERSDDGTWKVIVELLELERVPPTDDVLGSYEAHLDENGDLIGYERVERYTRSQVGSGQGADRGR
jgi:Gas vesicle synthesis protein GvpO